MIYNNIQTMHYLGNKRSLLNNIIPLILKNSDENFAVLDLFSGTSSIGYALKPYRVVYSNDIQRYGQTLAKGLMNKYDKLELTKQLQHFKDKLYFIDNYNKLFSFLKEPIEIEENILNTNIHDNNLMNKYNEFIINYPYYKSNNKGYSIEKWLDEEINKRKENNTIFPYMLCSTYYINGFFGIKQSIEIDSLKYAIDNICTEETKSFFMMALLYCMSKCCTSTGHFSQYRNITNLKSLNEIIKIRNKNIFEKFIKKSTEMINCIYISTLESELENLAFCENYIDLLKNKNIMKNVGCIYADPPYNKDNYSRYYHVPESIVRYDYPEVIMHRSDKSKISNGRYRKDDFISPFCRKTEAFDAFEILIKYSSCYNKPLLISYSDKGFVPIDNLIILMKKYYNDVIIYTFPYKHSKLGRKGLVELNEYILLGKNYKERLCKDV